MKFLCVSCDEPMKLINTQPPEKGSLTVLYRCLTCSHEIAMLTNPYETQVVGSLGVSIGGEQGAAAESKCPFGSVVRDLEAPLADDEILWTAEATTRLDNIPAFARPMAKTGIEKYATERGLSRVDAEVLEKAREFFGM